MPVSGSAVVFESNASGNRAPDRVILFARALLQANREDGVHPGGVAMLSRRRFALAENYPRSGQRHHDHRVHRHRAGLKANGSVSVYRPEDKSELWQQSRPHWESESANFRKAV